MLCFKLLSRLATGGDPTLCLRHGDGKMGEHSGDLSVIDVSCFNRELGSDDSAREDGMLSSEVARDVMGERDEEAEETEGKEDDEETEMRGGERGREEEELLEVLLPRAEEDATLEVLVPRLLLETEFVCLVESELVGMICSLFCFFRLSK